MVFAAGYIRISLSIMYSTKEKVPPIGVIVGLLTSFGAVGSSACVWSSVTFYRTCINCLSNKSLIKFCDCKPRMNVDDINLRI